MTDASLIAGRPHRPNLLKWANRAKKAEILVSFLSSGGLELIRRLLLRCDIDLTVSTYMGITERAALVGLRKMLEPQTESSHLLRVRVATGTPGYHGKVYRFSYPEGQARLVVGSANLTETGLTGTGDVSLVVCGADTGVPKLAGDDVPPIAGTPWSTRDDTQSLDRVLDWYREAPMRPVGSHAWTGVVSFINMTDASLGEGKAVDAVKEEPPRGNGRFVGEAPEGAFTFVVSPRDKTRWNVARTVGVDDIILVAAKDDPKYVARRCIGTYRGVVAPLRTERIFLFMEPKACARPSRAQVGWMNRSIPRAEWPPKLVAAARLGLRSGS